MFSMDLCAPGCGDAVVVALRGELDVADAAAAADDQVLVVDLAGLKFIDSSGVAALARARAHARLTGGDLLLAAPQRQVMRLLAATRLTDVFGIHACAAGHAGLPRTPAPETAAPAGLSPAA
jgi:anti-sigma B factor antagonist